MGVYIKGIEMPTGNDELRLIIHSNGQVIISHQTYYEEAEAVPVQPHGDLIDRDALLDTATIHWSQTTNESCFPIDEIEYAPTIIPASEEGE